MKLGMYTLYVDRILNIIKFSGFSDFFQIFPR